MKAFHSIIYIVMKNDFFLAFGHIGLVILKLFDPNWLCQAYWIECSKENSDLLAIGGDSNALKVYDRRVGKIVKNFTNISNSSKPAVPFLPWFAVILPPDLIFRIYHLCKLGSKWN